MNILFDTNIVLDVFLKRTPHFEHSAFLVGLAEQNTLTGWLGDTTVTTMHYLLCKELNTKKADGAIRSLLNIFNISIINRLVLETATEAGFPDYEDAVLHQSAIHSNLDGILTRNKKDFKKSKLPVYTPEELIAILQQE